MLAQPIADRRPAHVRHDRRSAFTLCGAKFSAIFRFGPELNRQVVLRYLDDRVITDRDAPWSWGHFSDAPDARRLERTQRTESTAPHEHTRGPAAAGGDASHGPRWHGRP